jgi:hypothetical protein
MALPRVPGPIASHRGAHNEHKAAGIAAQLVNLDQRKVAVHIHIQGREQLVFGVGEYQVDPDLGGVLRVQEVGSGDGPELMFLEDRWTGRIRPGHALGCDFLIHLA